MASKRDQLQAQQFLVQRVVSALVLQQTDPEQPPFRRPTLAAFSSVALAVVALAGVGIYGLFVPGGNQSFKDGKSIVVEKETSTRFVYLNGRLVPVTNYTSALLVLGDHAPLKGFSHNSLAGVPRGPQIGIPDAPDSLPDSKHLLKGPWTMCSQPTTDDTGTPVDQSLLLVGREPPGGSATRDLAVLLDVPVRGKQYLLWRGYRHEITDLPTVSAGLLLGKVSRVRAATAWVDVLPAGPAVGPISVAGAGRRSRALRSRPGTRAGQLFVVRTSTGDSQFYLATTSRLVPISQLQYNIQRATRQTQRAYGRATPTAILLGPNEVAQAGVVTAGAPATAPDLPEQPPRFVLTRSPDAAICAVFDAGTVVPRLTTEPTLPASSQSIPTARRNADGTPLADRVMVTPGWAALVEVVPDDQAAAGTISLISDLGRRYPLASPAVLKALGYDGVKPIRMPAGLAARIPEGDALDPAAAVRQTSTG